MARCLVRLPDESMAAVIVTEDTTLQGFLNELAVEHFSLLDFPSLRLRREHDNYELDLAPEEPLLPHIDEDSVYYLAPEEACSVVFRGVTRQLAFSAHDSATDIRRRVLNLYGSAIDCRVDDVALVYEGAEVQLPYALESGATYAVLARKRLACARVSVHPRAHSYVDVPIPATSEPVEAFKAMRRAAAEAFCIPPSIHIEFCRCDDNDPASTRPVCIAEALYDEGAVNYLSLLGHTIVPVSANDHAVIFVAMPTELTTLTHVRQALIRYLELDCAPHDVELHSQQFEALLCPSAVVQQDDQLSMRVASADLSNLCVEGDQLLLVQDVGPSSSPSLPSSPSSPSSPVAASADDQHHFSRGSRTSQASVYDDAAVRSLLESIRSAQPCRPYGTSGQIQRDGPQGVVVPNFVGDPPAVRVEELPDVVHMLFDGHSEPTPALVDDFREVTHTSSGSRRVEPGALVVPNLSTLDRMGVAVTHLPQDENRWVVRWTNVTGQDEYDIVRLTELKLLELNF